MHPNEVNLIRDDVRYLEYLVVANSLSKEHVKALEVQQERQKKSLT